MFRALKGISKFLAALILGFISTMIWLGAAGEEYFGESIGEELTICIVIWMVIFFYPKSKMRP